MKRFLIILSLPQLALLLLMQSSLVLGNDNLSQQLKRDWLRQAELRYPRSPEGKVTPEEDAAGAVNGIITGKWGFHTAVEKGPFWQVDLGESVSIERIVIYNRCDMGVERIRDLYASISDDAVQWTTIWENDGTIFYGATDSKPREIVFAEQPVAGRYLRLALKGENCLNLDEVQVYSPGSNTNIALHKSATQSSTCEWSGTQRIPGSVSLATFRSVLVSGRKLADDLRTKGVGVEDAVKTFDRLANSPSTVDNYFELRSAIRTLALKNPLLNFDSILFAKTSPAMLPHMSDQCLSFWHRGNGAVCILKNIKSGNPELVTLTEKWKNGTFFRPELSYCGKKVLFAYAVYDPAVADVEDKVNKDNIAEENFFHLFEMDIESGETRQLTFGKYDDFDGRYLPDGRIIFLSTRKGAAIQTGKLDVDAMRYANLPNSYVRCGGDNFRPVVVYTLHSMDSSGKNMYQISAFENFEWTPTILNDGRIAYTRWDYIDRYAQYFISIWGKNPDGTKATLIYGNYTINPDIILEPRAIPDSSKLVFVGAAHHATFGGSLALLDRNIGMEGSEPIERITPEVVFPESEGWPAHYYAHPHPLAEDYYLVSWSDRGFPPHTYVPDEGRNPSNSMGIYYYDRFGNLELLYRCDKISSVNVTPFASRPLPPNLPNTVDWYGPQEGEFVIQNIYEGLKAYGFTEETQCVKRLRIVATLPKTQPHMNVPSLGITTEEPGKFVLGTVPVEEDGSVYFRVPSGVSYFFQALDKDGVTIQTMRTLTYLMPGETASCIGCHENRESAPPAGIVLPKAWTRSPSRITPDTAGTLPLRYSELVQPVLDQNCVACHSSENEEPLASAFDLTAQNSFHSLLTFGGGRVQLGGPLYQELGHRGGTVARHYRSHPGISQMDAIRSVAMSFVEHGEGALKDVAYERDISIPGTAPASQARLLSVLRGLEEPRIEAHKNWQLDKESIYRLVVWMDLYAMYQGSFSDEQEKQALEFREKFKHLFED